MVRRTAREMRRAVRRYNRARVQSSLEQLNLWQEGFCVWNAERLGISAEESRRRYWASWRVLPGGHGGDAFRRFGETSMQVFSVISDDSPEEVYEAYELHSWLFLLRQLGQPTPVWGDDDPVLLAMEGIAAPVIIDYGCGMAQTSISLALALRERGAAPRLVLADIPSVRLSFVAWLCRWLTLPCETLSCTRANPLPAFPPAHAVVATEIFEHLHDPLPALEQLDAALAPGGFMITNVSDHEEEFMHVSPNLGRLRDRMAALGYGELVRNKVFRKQAVAVVTVAKVPA